MAEVHKNYPPQRREWVVTRPITQSMVRFFVTIAPSVESLSAIMAGDGPSLLSQLLTAAGLFAPRLARIHLDLRLLQQQMGGVHWVSDAVMHSLGFARQIKELRLDGWGMPEGGDLTEIQPLSGLRLLEVNPLKAVYFWSKEVSKCVMKSKQ